METYGVERLHGVKVVFLAILFAAWAAVSVGDARPRPVDPAWNPSCDARVSTALFEWRVYSDTLLKENIKLKEQTELGSVGSEERLRRRPKLTRTQY